MFNVLIWTAVAIGSIEAICPSESYQFEFTECDSSGQRWRVAVPRPGSQCDDLPPPQRGLNCTFYCHAGHYLDLETQSCRPCRAGRYSLGGGERFDEFVTLPHGFSIENVDAFEGMGGASKNCPQEAGWQLRDGELIYIPSRCISRLSFSAHLVRPGFVEFSYRMPRNSRSLSMQVDVQNEQCQSYSDMLAAAMVNRLRKGSEESNGDWRRRRVELRSGSNVVSWTVAESGGSHSAVEPIRIARIDVHGLAFTRECLLCPAGTYSEDGAGECIPCKPGYFSTKGSTECGKCPLSQYSGPRSEKCEDRPPCRTSDYYPVVEPCVLGKTKTVYKKVQPAICRDDMDGAAKAPPPSESRPCAKCNPGMAVDSTGKCNFCSKDQFSTGDQCKECPVNTRPVYGYEYTQWDVLPPNMQTSCEYINEDVLSSCNIGESWLASGSALVSSPSLQKGIALEFFISIDEGFHNPLAPAGSVASAHTPIATMTIVFETSCSDPSCVLYFVEDMSPNSPNNTYFRSLAVFNGTQTRRVWSHSILKSAPAKFMIAFLRSGAVANDDSITDTARIFNVNITNVAERHGKQGGGASYCMPCARGSSACVPCPAGHYMNKADQSCLKCPPQTVVRPGAVGLESCVACGENLQSIDGLNCGTNGTFTVSSGNRTLSYNLSPWNGRNWTIDGVKVFSREGTSYYHVFNVSLFGRSVSCEEHFEGFQLTGEQRDSVEGAVCRVTAMPETSGNHSSASYISPLLIASKLEAITTNRTHGNWTLSDKILEYEGVDNNSLPLDVHLWYDTIGASASNCPHGMSLAITVRCSPTMKDPQVRLPRTCPDGTCDGCFFHIIVEAAQACPICLQGDYDQIRGECVNGRQTIHMIPAKHCVLSGAAAETHEEACSVLSSQQRALLVTGAFTLLALAITLIVICKRNRRLEYKYTRLVESRNGELPAAETCGLEEDEDEEDRVTFSKGRRKLFGRNEEKAAFVPLENDD